MKLIHKNSRIECRKEIENLMGKNHQLVLLTSDGNDYISKHRSRHFDVGIAESNLIGIAAGLAIKDMTVIAYGITSFIVTNALMQIRNDLCFPNLKVIMLGIGSGISYASLGFTHHSLEDIGLLSNLPNMKIYLPADAVSARKSIADAIKHSGPSYIRIRTGNEPVIYKGSTTKKIDFSKPTVIVEGNDIIVFTYGVHVFKMIDIRKRLKLRNISAKIVDVNSIGVYPREYLLDTINKHQKVFVIEEHYVDTGLGSLIANLFIKNKISIPLITLGFPKEFCTIAGSSEQLLNHYNLGTDEIEKTIINNL